MIALCDSLHSCQIGRGLIQIFDLDEETILGCLQRSVTQSKDTVSRRADVHAAAAYSTSDSERAAVLQQLESVVAVMAQCDWKRQYLIRGHEVVVVVRTINNNETTSAARCIDNAPLSISSVFITHNLHQGGVMQSLLFVCHSVSSITHKHVNRCRPNMVGVGNGWPSGSGYILG